MATLLLLLTEMIIIVCCLVGMLKPRDAIYVPAENLGSHQELDAGVYRICIDYNADADAQACYDVTASVEAGKLLADTVNLYPEMHTSDSTIWLTAPTSTLQIVFTVNGSGSLEPLGMKIIPTGGLWGIRLFFAGLCFVLLDGSMLLFIAEKNGRISPDTKRTLISLIGITVIVSAPLFTDYVLQQDDVLFHLSRIEGVARGLQYGLFPVRIQPGWLGGQGYAASLFYGDLLLYFPAFLRLIGFPMQSAYQIFMVGLNFLTAILFYVCGKKLTGDRKIALVGTFVYMFGLYRLVNMYARGALGEAMAMTFLPLVIYGLYNIFSGDVTERDYEKAFIIPAFGYVGILCSHTLSVEISGLLTILLCICCIKRTFERKRLWQLVKTAIVSFLLGAWFLIPFLDELHAGTYRITAISTRAIQDRGLYIAHLLLPFMNTGSGTDYVNNGLRSGMPLGIGLSSLLILICYIAYRVSDQEKNQKEMREENTIFGMAVFCMILSLSLFPWDRIQNMAQGRHLIHVIATVISSFQFPWRFLSVATPLLAFLGMLMLKHMRDSKNVTGANSELFTYNRVVLMLLTASIITAGLFFADLVDKREVIRLYDDDAMGDGVIMGAEYVPEGTDITKLTHSNCYVSGELVLDSYSQKALTVQAKVSGGEGTLTVPLLYYKGYVAKTQDGQKLPVFAGENNQTSVYLSDEILQQDDGETTIIVTFVSPWYWRLAELISIIAVIGLILCPRILQRKEKKEL